ncbi:GGDEF domain-containing protein [Azospirillaceae bacterium]
MMTPGLGRKLFVLTSVVVLWLFSAWQISGRIADEREDALINSESLAAERSVKVIAADIRITLGHIRSIPVIISSEPSLVTLLSSFGSDIKASPLSFEERQRLWRADPTFLAAAQRLGEVVARQDIGINGLWLMNAAGDTFAVGLSAGDTDYTGANYGAREYFKAVRRGEVGHQFAVGQVTGIPGLFFAAPVIANGRLLGAAGVRTNLSQLSSMLESNAFVTDEYDVVILASDSSLLMRTLPGARVAALSPGERMSRYKRDEFEPLHIQPVGVASPSAVVNWPGILYPRIFVHHPSDFLNVHVFRDMPNIEFIREERIGLFVMLSLAGTLLIFLIAGGAVYFVKRHEHERELLCLNENLSRLVCTDSLTGCANRRHFMSVLSAEHNRAVCCGEPFSILALDIDYFKHINDQYGHQGGDRALCHFVGVVQSSLRSTDLLGRMGGEEFAVLLPKTGIATAYQIGERIRAVIATTLVPEAIAFTVSVGVAQWQAGSDMTEDELLQRADSALYAAKRGGRNRVETAQTTTFDDNVKNAISFNAQ